MSSAFVVNHADVYVRPIYTCSVCAAKSVGDSVRIELRHLDGTPAGLAEAVERKAREARVPRNMPVGWGSYYDPKGFDFRCNNHSGA